MQIARTLLELKLHLQNQSQIGFVPTMGALHLGHLSLVQACQKKKYFCVLSIFVNPTQFAAGEDFEKYPRTEKQDLEKCEKAGVDLVWIPTEPDIYPDEDSRKIFPYESPLFNSLCGQFRPGHFKGVLQVVNLLLESVKPQALFLGEKDYQQLILIKHFVQEKNMPIEIVGVPTLRDPDGLAMSSRNQYLNAEERHLAAGLYFALLSGRNLFRKGESSPEQIILEAESNLDQAFDLQYIQLVEADSLMPVKKAEPGQRLLAAAYLGKTRLIDNIAL